MEKVAWRAVIKEGMVKEYIKRHDEIWPEMVETLKAAVSAIIPFGWTEIVCSGIMNAKKGQNMRWIIKRKAKSSSVGTFPWIRS